MANVQNNLAKSLKALHKPGSPIILTNIYDASSAKAVASLPESKAIATASYAVAEAAGTKDDDLTSEINLRAAKVITAAVKGSLKPVTVDIQDGYGEQLEEVIAELLRAGVVGVNIEDYDKEQKKMYGVSEAAARIKRVLDTARQHGVPDFVVNARCDILLQGGSLPEAIARGQAYLAAGATTAFVWGGPSRGGISRDEVTELVQAFDGRLNVMLSGGLTTQQLADIGVARISIGPALYLAAMTKLKQDAEKILQG